MIFETEEYNVMGTVRPALFKLDGATETVEGEEIIAVLNKEQFGSVQMARLYNFGTRGTSK